MMQIRKIPSSAWRRRDMTMKRFLGTVLTLAAGTLLGQPTQAQSPVVTPRMACADLAGVDLSSELGAPAKVGNAGIERGMCHVQGTIRQTIGFEAWLPLEGWTGRYLQMGCGGLCGRIATSPPQAQGCVPLERGEFALASTDMGHRDPSAASWGANPERRIDFAHRAQHLTTRAAKLLITRFYGQAPRRSYFSGCSDGGREGIIAAQLYPEDFDGIVAGAPVVDFTAQNTFHHAWTVQKNRRNDGTAALITDRLAVLNRLVVAECGGSDGVVTNPLACTFDPMQHVCKPGADPAGCLSEDEARMAAAIYEGPRTKEGERLTAGGLLPGSEANWRGTLVPDDAATPPRAKMFSGGVLSNLAFAPGSETPPPEALSYDRATYARLEDSRRTYDATSTNLDRFFARGGRLIVWHGLADQDITPRTTIAWWAALRRDIGAATVDAASRLFLIPGLAHCRGGVGGHTEFDSLTPLLRWVEEGVAPEELAGGIAPTRDIAVEPFLGSERFGPGR
jgi:Tannase and feruloyl esterase